MQWKNIYWLYIIICLLFIAGIIVGLVFGLRTSSPNPIVIPTVTTVLIFNETPTYDFREIPPTVSNETALSLSQSAAERRDPLSTVERRESPEERSYNVTSIPISPMATTAAVYENLLLIGAPKEDTYGQVFVYQIGDELKEISKIHFALTGTPYQMAGYAIDGNIVCAPEFGMAASSAKPGTFFVLRDLAEDVEVQRESVDLGDGFVMKKRGRIFRYEHPYLYVAKESDAYTCIDMYQMDDNQTNWKFLRRVTRPSGNLFAADFVLIDNRLVVSELNVYHVYDRSSLQLLQSVDISGEYKEDLDLKQNMLVTEEGWLAINSPLNRFTLFYDVNMKLVKCERHAEFDNCTRFTDSGKIISCDFEKSQIFVFNVDQLEDEK